MFCIAGVAVGIAILAMPFLLAKPRREQKISWLCQGCGGLTNYFSYERRGFFCAACMGSAEDATIHKRRETLRDQLTDTRHAEHDEACSPWDQEEALWPVDLSS